jgi:hypothetical protein
MGPHGHFCCTSQEINPALKTDHPTFIHGSAWIGTQYVNSASHIFDERGAFELWPTSSNERIN